MIFIKSFGAFTFMSVKLGLYPYEIWV